MTSHSESSTIAHQLFVSSRTSQSSRSSCNRRSSIVCHCVQVHWRQNCPARLKALDAGAKQVEEDLGTMTAAANELEGVHQEIDFVRDHALKEYHRLHARREELRAQMQAAERSLRAHGFTGDVPADIQLYCHTTHFLLCCHCTYRYCYGDRIAVT